MIKMFWIFIVLLTATNTVWAAGNSAVQSAMQAARDEKEIVSVVVKDSRGKPISGLNITTANLVEKQYTAKTDASGTAKFEGVCSAFARIGREYSTEKRKNPKTEKRPVFIKITDPNEKYKDLYGYLEWDDYTGKTGCVRTITMKSDMIRETFPTVEQLKYAFDNRTGKLKFYNICTDNKKPGGKIQSGCIDVFKNVDTQLNEAIFLAQEYMLRNILPENNSAWIECVGTPIRTKGNQDFLKCTSTDGKYAYDFEFDDLIESTDNTVQKDAAQALCEIVHGGKFETEIQKAFCTKNSATETKEMCNQMRGTTYGLSWTTKFYPVIQVGSVYQGSATTGYMREIPKTQQNVCVFDFRNVGKDYNPATIAGIDNYKYEYIEVRSLPSLEFLLHQYVKAQIGADFDNFRCTSGFRQWNSPNGTKHIFECYVTSDDDAKSGTIEFVFDNINVRTELYSNAGEGGMNCIAAGGSFDGANCMGMTKEQCTELDSKTRDIGGATWKPEINQCVLNDAQKLQNYKKVGDALVTTIGVAGTVVVVVATAGTAAPAIAALAVAGGTISLAGTAVDMKTTEVMTKQVEKFKMLYNGCKNQPEEEQDPCARSVLQSFLGFIETYVSKGAFEGQYAKSLNEIFIELIKMTEPETITREDIKSYSLQKTVAETLVTTKQVATVATIVGDFASIFAGGANAIAKLSKMGITLTKAGVAVVNAANKGNKISRFFARVYNLSKKTVDKANDFNTVKTDLSRMSPIPSKTKSGFCWIEGYLKTPCK